jgi:hypothetical protein
MVTSTTSESIAYQSLVDERVRVLEDKVKDIEDLAILPSAPEQGDILYYDGSDWVPLSHGTGGQFLRTGGHGANPSWAAVLPSTSIEKGDILYYDGSAWALLHHGTYRDILISGGDGDIPFWSDELVITQGEVQDLQDDVYELKLGWIGLNGTWTYASADDPTYTLTVNSDLTSVLEPGDKIKLTQSSTEKYFIITAISYSSPSTTITLYGGTDYDLANAAISYPHYSRDKAPYGFPLSPDKWSVVITSTSDLSQASPTSGTWYNLGSLSITIPIGLWIISYEVNLRVSRSSAGIVNQFVTLSNANNTELSSTWSGQIYTSSSTDFRGVVIQIPTVLSLAAKATYYLNSKTATASMTGINFYGATSRATIIKAVCAYL